jgi:hypothetical protein
MAISPEDVLKIFGEDFVEEMKCIQRDVILTCSCGLMLKVVGLGSFKKSFRNVFPLKTKSRRGVELHTCRNSTIEAIDSVSGGP